MRHKLLAGIISFCSGKRKPSTFTSSSLMDCNHITTTNNMLHSKSTYFYRWSSRYISIAPIACALTLLVGIGLLLNPTTKAQEVYAAEDEEKCKTTVDDMGFCDMELGITMLDTAGETVIGAYNEQPATTLSASEVNFREYNFAIRAVDTKTGYRLYANAVESGTGGEYTNKLVNMDAPDYSINPISASAGVVGSSIPQGEWGYAFSKNTSTEDGTSAAPETLTYKALPTGAVDTLTPIDTDGDTIYDSTSNTHTDTKYKIYFGAKAKDDMLPGHYRTQVMLSLVAEPKWITQGITKMTKMSEITSKVCKATPTPAADAAIEDVPSVQLIDDREGENGTKYWVSKLADGNCWMTQNLMYDTNTVYKPSPKLQVADETSKKLIDVSSKTASTSPTLTTLFNDDSSLYNAHYLVGYSYSGLSYQLPSICGFSSLGNTSWKAPSYSGNTSFATLVNSYGIQTGSNSSSLVPSIEKIGSAPLYFGVFGYYSGYSNSYYGLGSEAVWWGIPPSGSYYSDLYIRKSGTSSTLIPDNARGSDYRNYGFVRCVVPGN